MFVASYARLAPGSGSILASTFNFPLQYRGFAVTIKLWVGSDRLLQCAVPPRYHFMRPWALYYNARYHLGTARALYYNARYRLGTARALHYNARYRLGTARALYYNARYRHPVCVLQSFNWIGMSEELPRKHQQKATKRNLNIVVPALLQTGRSTPLQLVLRGPASAPPGFQRPAD